MAIEAIMFDLGKVLVDFSLEPMISQMSLHCSKPAKVFEQVLRDTNLAYRYESGDISTVEFHDHLCQKGGLQMDFETFRRAWSGVFAPEPLVSESLLQVLRRKYRLLLISNTNEAHYEHIAENYRIIDYFDHKVLSFEVGSMKPEKRIYEHAIGLAGSAPETLFFTDDREENVRAARELGIHSHQFKSEKELVQALNFVGVETGSVISAVDLSTCPTV